MISLAFLAGVLAAFNPCGFVLLPAYLSSIIIGDYSPSAGWQSKIKAIHFSVGMTIGFIGVFGSFAVLLSSVARSIQNFLPYLTVIVGVAITVIAVSLILGKTLIIKKIANPNIAPTHKWFSQIGYGITFALASLSCTIGPFLAITASAISSRDISRIFILFLTYSIGMGAVVLLLALLVSSAKSGYIRRIKNSQKRVSKASGYILLVVGSYEIWYGRFEIQILQGHTSSDDIISFVSLMQSRLTQWLANLGVGKILFFLGILSTVFIISALRKKISSSSTLS